MPQVIYWLTFSRTSGREEGRDGGRGIDSCWVQTRRVECLNVRWFKADRPSAASADMFGCWWVMIKTFFELAVSDGIYSQFCLYGLWIYGLFGFISVIWSLENFSSYMKFWKFGCFIYMVILRWEKRGQYETTCADCTEWLDRMSHRKWRETKL